jgi:hypothetical protein
MLGPFDLLAVIVVCLTIITVVCVQSGLASRIDLDE